MAFIVLCTVGHVKPERQYLQGHGLTGAAQRAIFTLIRSFCGERGNIVGDFLATTSGF
jgi:hypothetical protein